MKRFEKQEQAIKGKDKFAAEQNFVVLFPQFNLKRICEIYPQCSLLAGNT
jgi:hypothetical protein